MKKMLIAVFGLCMVLTTGCWSSLTRIPQVDRPTLGTQFAEFKEAEQYMEEEGKSVLIQRYRIQPGVRLSIQITGASEMSQNVLVSQDGYIDCHYIGEVKVGGLSVPELKNEMSARLADFYDKPNLVVNFSEGEYLRNQMGYVNIINVSGGGGRLDLRGDENLIDVLAMARSITPASAWKNIAVYKIKGDDQPIIVECNIRKFLIEGDRNQNIPIRNGDIIYVPTEENDWLQEFYASLSVGNSILGGIIGWRDNLGNLFGKQSYRPYWFSGN